LVFPLNNDGSRKARQDSALWHGYNRQLPQKNILILNNNNANLYFNSFHPFTQSEGEESGENDNLHFDFKQLGLSNIETIT
jgi:hypothetical protein